MRSCRFCFWWSSIKTKCNAGSKLVPKTQEHCEIGVEYRNFYLAMQRQCNEMGRQTSIDDCAFHPIDSDQPFAPEYGGLNGWIRSLTPKLKEFAERLLSEKLRQWSD